MTWWLTWWWRWRRLWLALWDLTYPSPRRPEDDTDPNNDETPIEWGYRALPLERAREFEAEIRARYAAELTKRTAARAAFVARLDGAS